jgi:hypothetical protein
MRLFTQLLAYTGALCLLLVVGVFLFLVAYAIIVG